MKQYIFEYYREGKMKHGIIAESYAGGLEQIAKALGITADGLDRVFPVEHVRVLEPIGLNKPEKIKK